MCTHPKIPEERISPYAPWRKPEITQTGRCWHLTPLLWTCPVVLLIKHQQSYSWYHFRRRHTYEKLDVAGFYLRYCGTGRPVFETTASILREDHTSRNVRHGNVVTLNLSNRDVLRYKQECRRSSTALSILVCRYTKLPKKVMVVVVVVVIVDKSIWAALNSLPQKIKFSPRCFLRFDFFMAEHFVRFVLLYDNAQVWRSMPSFFGWNCTVRADSGDRGRILQGKLVTYPTASCHDEYRPSYFGFNFGPCVSRYNVYTRGVELPRTLGIIYLFIYLFLMNATKQIRSQYPRYILWSSTCLLCRRTANLF